MKRIPSSLLVLVIQLTVALASAAEPTDAKPELPTTGINVSRPVGGWINVEAVGIRLVVKFFDQEMKPTLPDVTSGYVRFRYPGKSPKRAVLNIENDTLATAAIVRPPHNFFVILNLFFEGTEESETHTFKYP